MTLLSIIIPVFNAESTIKRTLRSLERHCVESASQCEVIIIDDGSSDQSPAVITDYIESIKQFNNIRFYSQTNNGSGSARNLGLEKSCGEWILFIDSDDELSFDPIKFIVQNPEHSALLFSVAVYKNSVHKLNLHPSTISESNYLDLFINQTTPFAVSCIVFKKVNIVEPFNKEFIYLEDSLFWVMNSGIFKKTISFPDNVSSLIHTHAQSKTANSLKHGYYRSLYAEKLLLLFKTTLSRKQTNNLKIQAQIGLIQQQQKVPLSSFILFPCNIILYLKLLLYFVLKGDLGKLNFYDN